MGKDLTAPSVPDSPAGEAMEEPTPDSPQEQEEEAGAVARQAAESGPVDHVPAEETGLNSPELDTRSLSRETADDRLDHPEPEVATKPETLPPAFNQEQTLALAGPAGPHDLAPRTSAALQRSDGSEQVSNSEDRALATLHPDLLADMAYVSLSDEMYPAHGQLLEMAAAAARSFQKQMRPKDALESLALTQAFMTHGRVAWLTKLAASQKDPQSLVTVNEACDRASGTFVRLMRAIGEYRQPKNSGAAISIGQANLAQQQVVQNIQEVQGKKNVDERTRIRRNSTAAGAEALSAIGQGAAVAPDHHLAKSAVGEEHRPQKPGRKGANQTERLKTRRTVRRQRRVTEADEGDTKGTSANE